ncbi:hypothetical protein Y695_03194 [Hydrogenophaga sp. T4]|nr:hypothetical protein Y695_03194 [Hydrogenophaga sp. T4]
MMNSKPSLCSLATSTCTLVTSGQVASKMLKPRACASSCTALLTPCAENTRVEPGGTSDSSSMKIAPLALRSLTT